jgi:uncharacterized protein
MKAVQNINPNRSIKIVKLLLDNGADINTISHQESTALTCAVTESRYCNNIETIRLLLENKANINHTDDLGYTALMVVALYCKTSNHIKILKLLLDHKADINIKNNYDDTFLHCFAPGSILL